MNDIKEYQRIRIKENLAEILNQLGFEPITVRHMAAKFTGSEQTVHCIWTDSDGQKYVTVDLCCEIPIQCCEAIPKEAQ